MNFGYSHRRQTDSSEIIRQTNIENFEDEFRVKYGKYEMLYYQIMYYAEEAKKELSQSPSTVIEFSADIDKHQNTIFTLPLRKRNWMKFSCPSSMKRFLFSKKY